MGMMIDETLKLALILLFISLALCLSATIWGLVAQARGNRATKLEAKTEVLPVLYTPLPDRKEEIDNG